VVLVLGDAVGVSTAIPERIGVKVVPSNSKARPTPLTPYMRVSCEAP
jgi:hypothetical protein